MNHRAAMQATALNRVAVALLATSIAAVPSLAQAPQRPNKIVTVEVPAEETHTFDVQRRSGIPAVPKVPDFLKPRPVTSQFNDGEIDENRRYDQVTFVTSHNSFTSSQLGWLYSQQALTIPEQLKLGVRGLMLDIYPSQDASLGEACIEVQVPKFKMERVCDKNRVCRDVEKKKKTCKKVCGSYNYLGICAWFADPVCEWVSDGVESVCEDVATGVCRDVPKQDGTEPKKQCYPDPEQCNYAGENRARLCHEMDGAANCALTPTKLAPGKSLRTLSSALRDVKVFLDANPQAIVTIFFESKVADAATVTKEFTESGTSALVYAKQAGQAWPTIKELRSTGKRLVVFANDGLGGLPNNWDHVVETRYDLGKYPGCEIRPSTTGNVTKLAEVPLLTINHFYEIALDQPWSPSKLQPFDAGKLQSRIAQCKAQVNRTANFIALDFVDKASGVWPIVKTLNTGTR